MSNFETLCGLDQKLMGNRTWDDAVEEALFDANTTTLDGLDDATTATLIDLSNGLLNGESK